MTDLVAGVPVQIFDRRCTLTVRDEQGQRVYRILGPDERTLAESPMRLMVVAEAARLVQAEARA